MSATEASRNVASASAAGNGGALMNFLAEAPIDEDFAADVASARESVTDEMSPAWPGA